MIQRNYIKNCDGTVIDIGGAQNIWGKNIEKIKGKTPWKKPNQVSGGYNQDPQRVAHAPENSVSLSISILCEWGTIFILPSRKVDFKGVSHFPGRKEV